jgi:hypothetical protein
MKVRVRFVERIASQAAGKVFAQELCGGVPAPGSCLEKGGFLNRISIGLTSR